MVADPTNRRVTWGESKMRRSFPLSVMTSTALAITLGVAVPSATVRAWDEKLDAPAKKAQESPKPKGGAKLRPGVGEKLRWGEPVNGLRSALVIRPASAEPKADQMPDLYLVVQNVSDAPIRLKDATTAPKHHMLYLKLDGKIQMGIGSDEPTPTDVVLQPREVTSRLVFPSEVKNRDGQTAGSLVAEGALKDSHQTMVVEMKIERAPAGAWSGKLVTRETSGAAAADGGAGFFEPPPARPRP